MGDARRSPVRPSSVDRASGWVVFVWLMAFSLHGWVNKSPCASRAPEGNLQVAGAVAEFVGNDAGQKLRHLLLAFGAVELALGQAVDLRQERAKAGPELIAGGDGL